MWISDISFSRFGITPLRTHSPGPQEMHVLRSGFWIFFGVHTASGFWWRGASLFPSRSSTFCASVRGIRPLNSPLSHTIWCAPLSCAHHFILNYALACEEPYHSKCGASWLVRLRNSWADLTIFTHVCRYSRLLSRADDLDLTPDKVNKFRSSRYVLSDPGTRLWSHNAGLRAS